jgi:hypothetical protein
VGFAGGHFDLVIGEVVFVDVEVGGEGLKG